MSRLSTPVSAPTDPADARRRHYADFFASDAATVGLVVVGNCQAESLRVLLDPSGADSVRVPPIFELDPAETRLLHRLLSRTRVLVVQPVRAGYRGLPLGTAELRRCLPAASRTIVVPAFRYTGLHPHHVVVHATPQLPEPPLLPYVDLRDLFSAPSRPLTPARVRGVAQLSLSELARREQQTDVRISDLLDAPTLDHARTVNHPGNALLLPWADRIATLAGRPRPVDPGRPLLDSVHAPVDPDVADAWGLLLPPHRDTWSVDGEPLLADVVSRAHRDWLAAHAGAARMLRERHASTARAVGLLD